DVLLSRRPDLEDIKLTCENTNTTLPYVDLVNEILESYVVLGKLDASVAKDTGDSTAAELSADAEDTNAAADDRLLQGVFLPTTRAPRWRERILSIWTAAATRLCRRSGATGTPPTWSWPANPLGCPPKNGPCSPAPRPTGVSTRAVV